MTPPRPDRVSVRAPATSANLGPGFDALGLALSLYNDFDVVLRDDDELRVEVSGEGAGDVPTDHRHLVVRSMATAFERAGEELPGLTLTCANGIPHARGLGSSSSAIVGGVTAAAVLLGRAAPDGDLDRDWIYQVAADIEGHPDNVAPCVFGGYTIAYRDGERWGAAALDPDARLMPVLCVPEWRLSTERARGLLPETVSHADAAFNAGRAALMTAAVCGHPETLYAATRDRLHEAYRAPAMPRTLELIRDLRDQRGLPAVVSGAGPTVLVLCSVAEGRAEVDSPEIVGAIDSIRRSTGNDWDIRPLPVEQVGVRSPSPHP
ncbi:homoserine kinase [Nocardiopsis lambiniae]|uniref:Homoserine kinase n=1 Tax=Nocardiopsis lambiniae TaxID=3075539 RepID=A0ABU2M4Y4_9ACTN|nr:homoserine kinase [Nocardiopsis sp. DSM 44743]MDT0327708.1 homoserine kinase [Nocardiopsis sp. DSM 44743]